MCGDVVSVLRPRTKQALHLRAALDLEETDGVGVLNLPIYREVIKRDAGKIDALPAQANDLIDALLDRREHPETEQVDLQKAGVSTGILVPLAEPAALSRGIVEPEELDQRTTRDDHG